MNMIAASVISQHKNEPINYFARFIQSHKLLVLTRTQLMTIKDSSALQLPCQVHNEFIMNLFIMSSFSRFHNE